MLIPCRESRATVFLLLMLIYTLALPGCEEEDGTTTPALLTGQRVAVGNGQAWTEVDFTSGGEPSSLAVAFTADALEGLPGGHGPATEYVLPMPEGATLPPYDHATLDWNAHGHAPPGVYDVPHFDVHFYFIGAAERDLIGPLDSLGFNTPLPSSQLAADYIETPGGVPRMGAHVVDGRSPEISGTGPFTHTFIYGKFAGQLNFLEPMVSEAFLRTQPNVEAPIRQPRSFGRSGYFPMRYAVRYDAVTDTYRVALAGLTPQ